MGPERTQEVKAAWHQHTHSHPRSPSSLSEAGGEAALLSWMTSRSAGGRMCLPRGSVTAVYLKEVVFLEQPLGTGKYSQKKETAIAKSPERRSLANWSANCL